MTMNVHRQVAHSISTKGAYKTERSKMRKPKLKTILAIASFLFVAVSAGAAQKWDSFKPTATRAGRKEPALYNQNQCSRADCEGN